MTLTQKDLEQIKELIDKILEEKFRNLPTGEEFFSKMNELIGELKTIRKELSIFPHKITP